MPAGLYVILAIGVLMLIFLIYELATKKAYGTWKEGGNGKRFGAKELNSRWHTRSDDPRMYWKLITSHGIISIAAIAYLILELLE
jgi:hypothetical protein